MKKEYLDRVEENLNNEISKIIMRNQIEKYYEIKDNFKKKPHDYKINDSVFLKKGTLLHGTYKNFEGLKEIVDNGLISSWFIDGRLSKYPSSVGVWNLKEDYQLADYINQYSGGTIKYSGLLVDGEYSQDNKTEIIKYDMMKDINSFVINNPCRIWYMEQTKEARFMPSLIQDMVQIGIIFDGQSDEIKGLTKGDILNPNYINDSDVKEFVNGQYQDQFIIDRKNKDDFFTDRESAILFGIPSCFIEGILVGRTYEKDSNMLDQIKKLLPDCYICNLDGKVIRV